MSENEKCGEQAPVRVYWPSKPPMLMCVDHATVAKKASEAMGFYLHMEPVGGINACEHAKAEASR